MKKGYQFFGLRSVMGLLSCVLFTLNVNAQKTTLLVSIVDKSAEPVVRDAGKEGLSVTFGNTQLNNIISRYTVSKFERAYPTAFASYLRNVWKVEVNSSKLMEDLANYDHNVIPYVKIQNEGTVLYTPNDYGFVGSGALQADLDLINAKAAWDITKGDTSVLIGITDTYFDTTHPDLIGKFAKIRFNANYSGSESHGTTVSSLIASNTDNNTGMAAIGNKCRLDVSTGVGDDYTMMLMSQDGTRVLNGSWYNNCSYDTYQQGVYDEIYENGTIACFSAGNGGSTCTGATSYAYPASYDHNISVTAIGNQFARGTLNYSYNGATTGYSWMDVHDKVIGDPTTAYTHNDKVDIAAPGYGVTCGYYSSTNASVKYQSYYAYGTSFSSPYVAGTAGLMLSANKALSPYQVEYILKKTAANIDTIPQNVPYAGLLGAGRLNAGGAVSMASTINVNDPATATLFIPGIDISTKCMPTSSVKPVLKPTIVNGTPPYTYNWEALPGNTAVLSSSTAANPQVTSVTTSSPYVWFRLTVYDASPVQKVASKIIQVTLNNQNTYDLAIRDSYSDTYNEANNQDTIDTRDWNLWRSPDIWNRQLNDSGLLHQPANYAAGTNYMNVRVHNVGCAASPAPGSNGQNKIRIFWSFPSTNLKWQYDFSNAFTYTNTAGTTIPAGGEITSTPASIPVIQPGRDTVIRVSWTPVNYSIAAPKAQEGNLALYARISKYNNTGATDQGFGVTETNRTQVNVRKSNNLALNNIVKISIDSNTLVNSTALFLTNPDSVTQTMNFSLNSIKDVYKYMSGDFKRLMTVRIYLGNLYSRWVAGGRKGKYLSYDDNLKYISFDDLSNAGFNNISMNSGEHAFVIMEVGVKTLPFVNLAANMHEFMLSASKAATSELVGTINFEVYYNSSVNSPVIYRSTDVGSTTTIRKHTKGRLMVYPNPVSSGMLYTVYDGEVSVKDAGIIVQDIMGRIVYKQSYGSIEPRQTISVPVDGIAGGMYLIHIQGNGQDAAAPVKFAKIN
ncbi:S8 family serine peptidase [Chitinophagaceae bacterium MMS25-I14]